MKNRYIQIFLLNIVILLFFFLLPVIINAQQSKIDSLQNIIKNAKEDSNKVKIFNKLSEEITTLGYFSKSDSIAHDALQLSEKINFKKGIADSYNNIGINYYYEDEYANALEQYFKANKIEEELGDKDGSATSLLGIGEVYQDQGDDSSALIQARKSFKLYEETSDELGMADALIDIGWSYYDLGNDSTAIIQGQKALKLYEKVGNKDGIAASLDLIGKIYENQNDYSNALKQYSQSLLIKTEIRNNDGMATSFVYVAEIYLKQRKFKEALEYANKSLALSNEIHSANDIKEAEKTLSDIYVSMGNLVNAMEHYKKYIHLQDSIFGPRNSKKVIRIEMNFEFEMKQALEKAERDKNEAIYKAKLQLQSIFIIGLLIIVVLGIFLFNRLRVIKRQQDDIIKKNDLIERIEKWMIVDSGEFNNEAKLLTEKIEFAIRENIFRKLKIHYGEARWWLDGVPKKIQIEAAKAAIGEDNKEPHENFIFLLDYKEIIEKKEHWELFKNIFSDPAKVKSGKSGKDDLLKWFIILNEIRNKVSHPGRAKVTEFEFDFITELSNWLFKRILE